MGSNYLGFYSAINLPESCVVGSLVVSRKCTNVYLT